MASVQGKAKTKAVKLFHAMVRDAGACERCGRTKDDGVQLQCAHWISRTYAHTMTDFDNAFCLCSACHWWFGKHPTEWGKWAIAQRGEATYARLFEASEKRTKFDWITELGRLEQIMEAGL